MRTLKKEAPKLTQEVSTPCPSGASRPPHRARSQDVQSWALAGHNQLCSPLHGEQKRRFHGLSHGDRGKHPCSGPPRVLDLLARSWKAALLAAADVQPAPSLWAYGAIHAGKPVLTPPPTSNQELRLEGGGRGPAGTSGGSRQVGRPGWPG